MSVAFRRDSDEEHLEPKFELPIPPGPNLVTERGLQQIRARLAECEANLASLANQADEDAIKAAKRRYRYWQTRQSTAQPMPAPDGNMVAFGCSVTFALNGTQRVIHIVGDDEADPAKGLISFSAPLCRAMMNAETGDYVDFAGKDDAIEIVAITGI